MKLVASIDQGTTGTTVLLFDEARVRGRGYREFPQSFPAPGQVEHDPEAIWTSVIEALGEARAQAGDAGIAAIGITNQRETTVLWDRQSGRPVAPISKVRRVDSGLSITINADGAVIDAYVVTDRPEEVETFLRESGLAR